jgi:hypothetical protein
MNELGLAAAQSQSSPMRDLDQIIAMLKQGVTPEELVQAGIPEEVVMEAVNMLSQETTQIPQDQVGLAGMQLGMQ